MNTQMNRSIKQFGDNKEGIMSRYHMPIGESSFLTPAAAIEGVILPDPGESLVQGSIFNEEEALIIAADKILAAKNPTLFPGPLVIWNWSKESQEMAKAVRKLAEAGNMNIIPMTDYRPKYPKINPESEINPNHPNITIWHNAIDVCLFVGVHCHYSNIALKIIRGGTDCFTIALCSFSGDDEAHLTVRDVSPEKVDRLSQILRERKAHLLSASMK
jgi:hypothetical protein